MEPNKPMTDGEKLDAINKRLKHVEINSYIHIAIVVIGFLGIVSLGEMISKIKNVVK